MMRLQSMLLGLALTAGGCATTGLSRPAMLGTGVSQVSHSVRMCSLGNGPACDELRDSLEPLAIDAERARAAAAAIENASRDGSSDLSRAANACRGGDSAACERIATALADGVAAGPETACRATADCDLARSLAAVLPALPHAPTVTTVASREP